MISQTKPALQVRVSVGTIFLAASIVAYNAPLTVTLDVTLPADAPGLPSEYETLTANLLEFYAGKLSALKETEEQQDITVLANISGWDGRLVAMAALADLFSGTSVPLPSATPANPTTSPIPPAPASTPAPLPISLPPPVSLKPEFYYALFRAGLPANGDSLFQASPKAVQAVWEQAIKQGVIPQSLSGEIAGAVQTFTTLSATHTLSAKPPIGISSMHDMLQASLPNTTQQQEQQFAQLYSQYHDDMPTFWSEVEKSFGATAAKQLQLHGQLFYLTLNNAPLVSALVSAEGQIPLTSTLDLATRGYYSPDKWLPLIGNSIPPQIPGAGVQQHNNDAQLLATQVRLAYPTAVVADLVRGGTFPLSDKSVQATRTF